MIAYIRLREIEAEIVRRRGEPVQRSWIKLENFYGIEIKDFAAEVARLSLLIAEFQCDVRLIGQKEAKALMLPLKDTGQIRQGNALRIDWFEVCPPTTASGVKTHSDDLFRTPLNQPEIDFENEGGETYICGNPPYLGSTWQSKEQKDDLKTIFDGRTKSWKSLDYVAGWFMKAADYGSAENAAAAFVSTNSICQGQQVPILWPLIFQTGHEIAFAYTSFKWANLASHNAGVTVVIVGTSKTAKPIRSMYSLTEKGETVVKQTANINAYLVPAPSVIVDSVSRSPKDRALMVWGNKPTDDGNLVVSSEEMRSMVISAPEASEFIRPYFGAAEFIRGLERFCLWIEDDDLSKAREIPEIRDRIAKVRAFRLASKAAETRPAAEYPHRFRQIQSVAKRVSLIVPQVSSESREYLPIGMLPERSIVSNLEPFPI